jgi:hypothetical protein
MYSRPMIFPLDPDGVLYSLQDEKGDQIGVGSREVCQTLMLLITSSPLMSKRPPQPTAAAPPSVLNNLQPRRK